MLMDVEMQKRFKLRKTCRGAALIEYVLIVSLLSLALVGGYRVVGSGYTRIYNNVESAL